MRADLRRMYKDHKDISVWNVNVLQRIEMLEVSWVKAAQLATGRK